FRVRATLGAGHSDPSNVISVEGTDPAVTDTDGDGIPDGAELLAGLDPYADSAYEDADGDRYPNLLEYRHGSAMDNDASIPSPDWIVDGSQPASGNRYQTLQAAVDQVSADDEIILVRPGVYTGSGNRGVTLPSSYRILLI